MKMDGYTTLAKMFNENKPKHYIGASLAIVVEPLPNLKIKLLNGIAELDTEIEGDNLFIARSITNRKEIDVTFKDFESKNNSFNDGVDKGNEYKNLSASGGKVTHPSPTSMGGTLPPPITDATFIKGDIAEIKTPKHENKKENKEKGKQVAQFVVYLKKDDLVLVIPNETEDQFFIVDVFDNVKEVSLDWEYYQK